MRILGLVGVVGLLGLSLKTRLGRRLGGALVMLSLLGGATVMASDTKFTQESTIAEVLAAPEFKGYARYLLPLELGYDADMELSHVGRLLPYHRGVDPQAAVEILNLLSQRAQSGERIYYPLGPQDTGVFVFKGKLHAPTALIAAGGGFAYVGSIHEGFPYALYLNYLGYNALVLQYRTDSGSSACQDLMAAINFMFEHAQELELDPEGYALIGSSAGARMAAAVGAASSERAHPAAAVLMAYTGYHEVSAADRPTYMVCGNRDGIAPYRIMQQRAARLNELGIPALFELAPGMGHGFGLGTGTSAADWLKRAAAFWQQKSNK